jgi:hypothetical protein
LRPTTDSEKPKNVRYERLVYRMAPSTAHSQTSSGRYSKARLNSVVWPESGMDGIEVIGGCDQERREPVATSWYALGRARPGCTGGGSAGGNRKPVEV